jgi:L-rhamnose isomerase
MATFRNAGKRKNNLGIIEQEIMAEEILKKEVKVEIQPIVRNINKKKEGKTSNQR